VKIIANVQFAKVVPAEQTGELANS
jgi:hypothetical protein